MHLPVSKDYGASVKSADSKGTTSRKGATVDGSLTGATTTSKSSMGMEMLEKPQMVLPCPRCESMNTKFCYYNNYSVNQPRHFCRQCQRYWTVGGTLRNVPVGGGSRKKNRRSATEPYPGPGAAPETTGPSPIAMATSGGLSPTMSFQQFLAHDVPGAMGTFNFSQLAPGFMPQTGPFGAYPGVIDQSGQGTIQYVNPLSSKQEFTPMYGTGQMQSQPVGGNKYFPNLSTGALRGGDQANVGVKAEFWGHMNMPPQAQAVWDNSQAKQSGSSPVEGGVEKTGEVAGAKSGAYDSSMLLQLGLTSRPPATSGGNKGGGGPVWNQVAPKNSSSPPHDSSTIEEEGNTPTNGYSNNGYEEGDAVSSMWAQNMHDMQDILCTSL